jgi:putative transposase
VHGVSTRKVDDLVAALGAESGISKSEVSRICAELDTDVAAFNTRDLGEQDFPYVFLDATYCKARVGGDTHGKGARVEPVRASMPQSSAGPEVWRGERNEQRASDTC